MSHWGVNLALWPGALFFGYLFTFPVPRTSQYVHGLWGLSCLGALLALTTGPSTEVGLYSLIVGALGSLLYTFWYSDLARPPSTVIVGKPLPSIELIDENQTPIILPKALSGKPLLLMFYRGNWCPLCMAQIKEIAGHYKTLADYGVETLLISPQPHKNSQLLATKFSVPFHFLEDRNSKAASRLNIVNKDGVPKGLELLGYNSDSVFPTIILTNEKSEVIFADLTDNYRVRPEPEQFIALFQKAGVMKNQIDGVTAIEPASLESSS